MKNVYGKNGKMFEDYKEIHLVDLKETLSVEDIEDGLEPMEEVFKVCVTGHAYGRMYSEVERFCEYEEVESLLISKGTGILNAPMNEEIFVLREDEKLGAVITVERIEGQLAIVLITVIRNVINCNGYERERKVKNTRNTKTI